MINKIENILSNRTYKQILNLVKSFEGGFPEFGVNQFTWIKELRSKPSNILLYNISNKHPELFEIIKNEVEEKIDRPLYKIDDCILYLYQENSYIQWHTDTKYLAALSIYLNEEWDKDWGGYFLYEDGEDIKAVIPKKNLGILQEGSVMHCVTPVISNYVPRISLQFFIRTLKDKKDSSLI